MKKGFTLVELLGAITILAILLLLAFPPILEQIRKSKENLGGSLKQLIYSATEEYLEENKNTYPRVDQNTYCISLKQLVESNYLKNPIHDGNKEVPLESLVKTTFTNGEPAFEMDDSCVEQKLLTLRQAVIAQGVVNRGSGLYKIGEEYRFRGGCNLTGSAGSYSCSDADLVNNYVSINGQQYRIIVMDSQGVKVMTQDKVTSMNYDKGYVAVGSCTSETCPRNNAQNTFCQVSSGTYWGCSVYAAPIGESFTAGSKIGIVTQNSSLYDYLNTSSTETAVTTLRNVALSASWNIGAVTDGANVALSTIQTQEAAYKANFKLGLINTSDYIQGSLDTSCVSDPVNRNIVSQACKNQNWIFNSNTDYPWTINVWTDPAGNSFSVWHVSTYNGTLIRDSANTSHGVRPVGYLPSDIQVTGGTGTVSDPWVVAG